MTWTKQNAKAGPGRPSDVGIRAAGKRLRAKNARRLDELGSYDPEFVPYEVLQRDLDDKPLPNGKPILQKHIDRANELLPFTMPKLQAVQIVQPPPPTPRADLALRGASVEALEMLRDALALCLDEAGRQIEGQLAAPDGDS